MPRDEKFDSTSSGGNHNQAMIVPKDNLVQSLSDAITFLILCIKG